MSGQPTPTTIGILYPGSMGASLAKLLSTSKPDLRLLTSLTGRSQTTINRATSSGLINVPLSDLVSQSDIILSILPPSSALALVHEIIPFLSNRNKSFKLLYIDANAIAPTTTSEISKLFESVKNVVFVDGSILGGPARDGYCPKLYLSADERWEEELKLVGNVLGGWDGKAGGLNVRLMAGAGEGAASALKMCYGGINKGYIGLATLMILSANAHSPATAKALLEEFADSKTDALDGFTKALPDMIPKAYRWVGEMEEISSFIQTSLSSKSGDRTGNDNAKAVSETFQGIANVFQRIADELKTSGGGAGVEVEGLLDFAKQGKVAVAEAKRNRN